MAFSKYANAQVVTTNLGFDGWQHIRENGKTNFATREASKVALAQFHPDQYLLSHVTIMASADTEDGPGPLGRHLENGFEVNRKFANYYVTPGTQRFINSNNDFWERKALLNTYRTFIGAPNYLEHLQIPTLSKGKIVDAAARDIGDSVYIDILVATERKHKPLIAAITEGRLSTMSMGCTVAYTVCSQCGNVANDETELCAHIKFSKGNTFIDEMGRKGKVAEACGHFSDPSSVSFIEGSWVGNPAFKGAVLREILSPKEIASLGTKLTVAFSQPVRTANPTQMQRAAKQQRFAQFGMDDQQAPKKEAPKEEADPMSKAVDDLVNSIRDKATRKVREDLDQENLNQVKNIEENRNENLIKSAIVHPEWKAVARKVMASTKSTSLAKKVLAGLILHKNGGWSEVLKTGSFTGNELLAVSRTLDTLSAKTLIAGENRVYRTVIAVGGMAPYSDIKSYLSACRQVVGRDLSSDERLFASGKNR
jgi:hypothetical protein